MSYLHVKNQSSFTITKVDTLGFHSISSSKQQDISMMTYDDDDVECQENCKVKLDLQPSDVNIIISDS